MGMVARHFNDSDALGDGFWDTLYRDLQEDPEAFFYKVKYKIALKGNYDFTGRMSKLIVEIFLFCKARSATEISESRLTDFLLNFFENTVMMACTERRNMHRQHEVVDSVLKHMASQLNVTLETQKLTIANISHEMRTLLNAIIGYLRFLTEDRTLQAQQKGYIEKAYGASEALLGLTNDVLDVTKINAGQLEIKPTLFWLDEMLLQAENAVAGFRQQKKHIRFKAHFDFFSSELLGDRQRILSIVINLLSNAFKYTDEGSVSFSVKKTELADDTVRVLFSVEDTGMGMSEQELENVFHPFIRYAKERKGVGLGLFIAKKLAIKMGGNLEAESRQGEGSRFLFSVELKQHIAKTEYVKNMTLCFFSDKNDQAHRDGFNEMITYLKTLGARVASFRSAKNFINYLINTEGVSPDVVCIATEQSAYRKYDVLIPFLREYPRFKRTYFIASSTEKKLPLESFDKSFERLPTLSTFLKSFSETQKCKTECTAEKSLTILAVDDLQTNLEVLKLFIMKQFSNTKLDLAQGGYEAVGMCKIRTYDLVFLDLKMPGMNGFEVFETLRTLGVTAPIYALSADAYDDTMQKVEHLGFDGMLEKPIQPEVLYSIIERLMLEKTD